jgi:glucosamine--fructose-6-phosphate aminotransferase (isomerizing)
VARKGSPLVIGVETERDIVASDVSAIVAHTRQVIYLQDGDVAVVTREGAQIYTLDNVAVDRAVASVEWEVGAAEKGGYEHFMLKEIPSSPPRFKTRSGAGWTCLWERRSSRGSTSPPRAGCHPARGHRGLRDIAARGHGRKIPVRGAGGTADLPRASGRVPYCNPIIGPNDLVVAISQSGETADTLAAVRESVQKGALVAGSATWWGRRGARSRARRLSARWAGDRRASTKAFTAQVTVLLMMALKLGRCRRLSRELGLSLCAELQSLPALIESVLAQNDRIGEIAAKYAQADNAFFIGRGILYPTALEGP